MIIKIWLIWFCYQLAQHLIKKRFFDTFWFWRSSHSWKLPWHLVSNTQFFGPKKSWHLVKKYLVLLPQMQLEIFSMSHPKYPVFDCKWSWRLIRNSLFIWRKHSINCLDILFQMPIVWPRIVLMSHQKKNLPLLPLTQLQIAPTSCSKTQWFGAYSWQCVEQCMYERIL